MEQGNLDAILQLGNAYDENGIATQDLTKAVEYYTKAYDTGDAHGAFCLGTMYENGKGVDKNETKAFELYTYASDKGHARATVKVGIFLHDGLGVNKDISHSIEYFEKAKAMGDAEADNMLAFVYTHNSNEEGTDPVKAFEFNIKRANENDAEAQYQVYQAYDNGVGIEKDTEQAIEWLKKAADNGHSIAQALMGFREMVMGNTLVGVSYWEKASANGHLKAMHDLADVYLNGQDEVPMNKARALELYRKSAEQGFAESEGSLGICYATGNGVEHNDTEAVKWFEKAANKGDQYAQKNLAICYRNGQGVIQNKTKAVEWFSKAVEQGNIQAKACLADMYSEDEGIAPNYSMAETLYKDVIASEEKDYYDEALFSLAHLYSTKLNNNFAAFPLWKQSAERGNGTAQYNLGLCYHNGWGTSPDDNQALFWWQKAADQGDETAQNNIEALMSERNSRNSYQSAQTTASAQKSGGCYVATAVYGSYDCPEVWTLRRFRDYTLAETWYGRAFIKTYYAISPTLVKWFGDSKWFKSF